MTRLATVNDITQLIELGHRLVSFSFSKAKVDERIARKYLARAIHDRTHVVIVAEHKSKIVGFIIGAVADYWFSKEKFATDLVFYCHEQHGNYAPFLVKKFIKWAKQQPKVIDISMAISSGVKHHERIGAMYEKVGMTHVGGVYTQLIGDQHE